MLHTANVAQSTYQISPQASMYTPITTLPQPQPSYVSGFDSSSKWHTAALQVAAMESMTLPTRLKQGESGRATFDDIENTISNGGKRIIAELGLTLGDPATLAAAPNGHGAHDVRVNGHTREENLADDESVSESLDITTPRVQDLDGRRQAPNSTTIFGQAQTLRGKWKSTIELEEINHVARDRFSSGPRVTR